MKKIISGIIVGFAMLSVAGVAQAGAVNCGDGSAAANPLCPAGMIGDVRKFAFGAADTSKTHWFESEHGVDYVYTLDNPLGSDLSPASGVSFASIELSGIGSSVFDLFLWNSGAWSKVADLSVALGVTYSFAGVDTFKISATTWDAGQNDFAAGLTFTPANDNLVMYQNPIAAAVGSGTAPEPATLFLMGSGLLCMGWRRKKN